MSISTEQILIFDGECGFCTLCARWIARRWTSNPPPRALTWQSLERDWPEGTTPRVQQMRESVWWIEGDRHEAGSRAIADALLATSGPWRVLGSFILRPPVAWIAPRAYRFVARHRHQLPGGMPACQLAEDL